MNRWFHLDDAWYLLNDNLKVVGFTKETPDFTSTVNVGTDNLDENVQAILAIRDFLESDPAWS